MSDLLSLGASGINAYQRALATVSNNIANVATDGYSRQTVSFQSTTPKAYGTNYVGTGVGIEAVVRQYDAFIESNLRGSLSDLKSQAPLVNYANRVVDLMADESTSLTLTMGKFFASARDLAAEPASLIARNVFLRSADSTASSFRLISEQLDAIEAESRIGIGDIPKSVNTLAEQLSLVNKQLGRTPLLENQPAELLDERDRLLRQMSEQIRIRTQFATNGEVKVSLTDNFDQGVIVERDKAQTLGLEVGGDSRVSMVLNPFSPDKRETLGSMGGGTLGGLLGFREQVLKPMQENLNLLAKTFMDEINAIHRQGVDAMGRPGEDLFTLAATGGSVAQSLGVGVVDPQRVAAASAFRVVAEPLNQGGSLARIAYTAPPPAPVPALQQVVTGINTHPDASVLIDVQTITPLATVAAGSKDTVIYLDPDGDQWLQVMTRDG
ncbi:MAG: flagellar hook-associated protein FlgK, partial [Betaproteobacteria bacterium]|nr:flagellar hook-associated protein FlgK [Betaproteobacteria bacterium]